MLTVLAGAPGYINMLDALNSWPLVKACACRADSNFYKSQTIE